MVALPMPTAQSPPVVSVLLWALSIASRKSQKPLPDVVAESIRLLTVIVLAPACSPDWVRTMEIGKTTASRTTMNFSDARAAGELLSQAEARWRTQRTRKLNERT